MTFGKGTAHCTQLRDRLDLPFSNSTMGGGWGGSFPIPTKVQDSLSPWWGVGEDDARVLR